MSYSRWSNSRWYTYWSAMCAEPTQYKWPSQRLKNNQVFEICDHPSYLITYGDLIKRSRAEVLEEITEHFSKDFRYEDSMTGQTHIIKGIKPTWDELNELQDYFSRFIIDVDEHFQFWNFIKYEWYYPLRNKIKRKFRIFINNGYGRPKL